MNFEKRITGLFSEFDDVHWKVGQDMWCSLSISMNNDDRDLKAGIFYEWGFFAEAADALLDFVIFGSCTIHPNGNYWGQNVEVIQRRGKDS